jgi:hypothetical protein
MNTIFPGMAPYLEDPTYWVGVHDSLAVYIRDVLNPVLLPRYVASLEERVYVQGPSEHGIGPDVWIRRQPPVAPEAGSAVGLLEPDAAIEVEYLDAEMHESFVNILDRRDGERVVTVIEVLSLRISTRAPDEPNTYGSRARSAPAKPIWSRSTCSGRGRIPSRSRRNSSEAAATSTTFVA